MKRIKLAFLLATLLLGFNACEEERDLGPIEEETYSLTAFDELQTETLGNITLVTSDEYKVVVRSHRSVLDKIRVESRNGELLLHYSDSHRNTNNIRQFEYTVYAPYFNRISLKDVADIVGNDGFETERLEIELADVGDITLHNIMVKDLSIRVNGVGDVRISGETETANYVLQDVGDIHAFDMVANECTANLKGVGDIEVNVEEELEAVIQGVGSIYYKGYPSITVDISGEGKLRDRN